MPRRPRAFVELAQAVNGAGHVSLSTAPERSANRGWGVGRSRLAPFDWAPPTAGLWSRESALGVPTISRARDLICSTVAALPITLWSVRFDPATGTDVEARLPPPGWAVRPDPDRTRQHLIAWTSDDLFFYGRAYWRVTDRYDNTYPSAFRRMAATDVGIDASGHITFNGKQVPPGDVVEFLAPGDGILYTGARAIQTAINLDSAAERFSTAEIPAGWLAQRENSEPMSSDELADMADAWQAARLARTTAALNPWLEWHESTMDPARLQLTEARQHQALELARVANIPSFLVGAPSGGSLTYQNSVQAKSDLLDFGCLPMVATIEQTLSGPNVTPRGQFVRLYTDAWLRSPLTNVPNQTPPNSATADVPRQPGRPRQADGLNEGTPQ